MQPAEPPLVLFPKARSELKLAEPPPLLVPPQLVLLLHRRHPPMGETLLVASTQASSCAVLS
ncbi:hypothetical protein [Bartonella sp. MR168JLCBS]|uniref:hypothetical protein n=1 Tax=Bartonella sp. MR168JLCBS TaxID=3243556 RepID=UPI0035CFA41E